MKPNISASDCVPWYWSYINASTLNPHAGAALTKLVVLTRGSKVTSDSSITTCAHPQTAPGSAPLSVEAL